MVSGFLYLLGRLLARCSITILITTGARRFAGVFSLLGSGGYVLLSGSGVPAVRAWLMSAVVLIALVSGLRINAIRVVVLVMVMILMANPLVVHQQGFWLSFAAVFSLVAWFEPTLQLREPARYTSGMLAFAQA